MYKLIVTDADNNILTQEFHNRQPNEELLNRMFYRAVKQFQTFIFIRVEQVKYVEM